MTMVVNGADPFYLLLDREILDILDGDTPCGECTLADGSKVTAIMPYLKGQRICEISTSFGYVVTYNWGGGNLSRWQYLKNLIEYCVEQKRCSDLLAFLFKIEHFSGILGGCSRDEIDVAYNSVLSMILDSINSILYFKGHELVVVGQQFMVRKIGGKVTIATPRIKAIDQEYIKSISSRAMQDVEQKNFDSAITKSRTLLEEVFCYAIEKKGTVPSDSGDIAKLYKQVRELYNMHTDGNIDKRIKTLLSGLNSIVSAIAEMRNKDSDAHGVGANRIAIDEHHARLFVNAAMTMADFILSVENKANSH